MDDPPSSGPHPPEALAFPSAITPKPLRRNIPICAIRLRNCRINRLVGRLDGHARLGRRAGYKEEFPYIHELNETAAR
jgi:hypothetical protein